MLVRFADLYGLDACIQILNERDKHKWNSSIRCVASKDMYVALEFKKYSNTMQDTSAVIE